MKIVLAAIDFSSATPGVVETASALAEGSRGCVVLLHVVEPPSPVPDFDLSGENHAELTRTREQAAEAQLEELRAALASRGIDVHALRLTGHPATDIVEQAQRMTADCIVLGSHGPADFQDAILGRTTRAVLRNTARPVIVVPTRCALPRELHAL